MSWMMGYLLPLYVLAIRACGSRVLQDLLQSPRWVCAQFVAITPTLFDTLDISIATWGYKVLAWILAQARCSSFRFGSDYCWFIPDSSVRKFMCKCICKDSQARLSSPARPGYGASVHSLDDCVCVLCWKQPVLRARTELIPAARCVCLRAL